MVHNTCVCMRVRARAHVRTIYIRFTYGMIGRGITIYGHIRCIYTVLANLMHMCASGCERSATHTHTQKCTAQITSHTAHSLSHSIMHQSYVICHTAHSLHHSTNYKSHYPFTEPQHYAPITCQTIHSLSHSTNYKSHYTFTKHSIMHQLYVRLSIHSLSHSTKYMSHTTIH
jgi:hypothetical protein